MTGDAGPAVSRLAEAWADPDEVARRHRPPRWWRQSLASGALAVALLHVQRARNDATGWDRAHRWLRTISGGPVDDGPGAHLHYGAPAFGYVLHHAAAGSDRYARALDAIDDRVAVITRLRLDTAHRRLDTGRLPALAEFDAIRGLTGLGAYWLHRSRARDHLHPLLPEILTYLVRLTEPLRHPALGTTVPGWWTPLAPNGRTSDAFPGGHANHGVAHGVAGPMALLALTARAGIHVHGRTDAIGRIQAWLDRWRTTDGHYTSWPYWITPADLAADDTSARTGNGSARPSWCYGTPGLARAQQLAALALDQPDRRYEAEAALRRVLTGPAHAGLTDASLCHGHAGLLHVVHRVAAEAPDGMPSADLSGLRARAAPAGTQRPWGLLEGAAGNALALTPDPRSDTTRWDTCLLTG